MTASQAASLKLAFVNAAGNAIMKVDNTTALQFNEDRNSVHIASRDYFSVGSVWVADMLHVPYGVSRHFIAESRSGRLLARPRAISPSSCLYMYATLRFYYLSKSTD